MLAIIAGGLIGASLSFSFLALSRSNDVPAPDPVVAPSATVESATRVAARVGTVTGHVTHAQTGGSVAAVQVYIASLQLGGLSQWNGRYLLQNVPAGTHTLSVSRIGYRTVEAQITIGGGQTVEQNFAVSEEALQLDPIVVTGTPGTELLEPIFTPMTVRPEIRNRSEVQAALMREYPPILRDAGIGGQVVVWFFISETGQVLDRRVSESSGQALLDEAALHVADIVRFTPALNRDQAAQVWIEIPITFQVQ